MSKYSYLIGKNVSWKDHIDSGRGTYNYHEGLVLDIKGNNVFFEDDVKWVPYMHELTIIEDTDKTTP
jgi:hypothetical protein